jgi:hypothetical protein
MPANPCQPCNAGAYQLQCRSKSGSATLCGWAEFVPSSRPRYYLTGNYSGTAEVKFYSGEGFGCSTGNRDTTTATASGAKRWDPVAGCVQSSNAKLVWTYDRQSAPPTTEGGTCDIAGSPFGLDYFLESCSSRLAGWEPEPATRTRRKTALWSSFLGTPSAKCGCSVSAGSATVVDCGSTMQIDLADEDTEEAAMERSPAAWSAWAGGLICCTATGSRNGTGSRSFNYTQSEYRIRVAGTPGPPVLVELIFSRDGGAPYTQVEQYFPSDTKFPADKDAGWVVTTIETAGGSETCLIGHRIYTP